MSDSSSGERCDKCGAAAKTLYLTIYADGTEAELLMCGHHTRQHGPAIVAAGFDAYELAVPDVRAVGASPVAR